MATRSLPMLGAAVLGFAAAALCFSIWSPKPAVAQFGGQPQPVGTPGFNVVGSNYAVPTASQPPLAIQALDAERFVVATREARLVQQIGREGTAQNMVVTVVTHYTVRGDRLLPVEHVRVPTGYRAVELDVSD